MRLKDPPKEMIASITAQLDVTSLCAIQAVSRTIHDHTFHAYASECFGMLKICLHPASLQVLTEFPTHRYISQHVPISFVDLEWFGAVDLLHIQAAKNNVLEHPRSATASLSITELFRTRERLDSGILVQAFVKSPQLNWFMMGDVLRLGIRTVRPSWEMEKVQELPREREHWLNLRYADYRMEQASIRRAGISFETCFSQRGFQASPTRPKPRDRRAGN